MTSLTNNQIAKVKELINFLRSTQLQQTYHEFIRRDIKGVINACCYMGAAVICADELNTHSYGETIIQHYGRPALYFWTKVDDNPVELRADYLNDNYHWSFAKFADELEEIIAEC